jgi:hypothetical protein
MYLSGHYHRSAAGHTAERYKIDDYSAILVQAGTVSTRQRSELQSFNIIKVDRPVVTIETYIWNPKRNKFLLSATREFAGTHKVWKQT